MPHNSSDPRDANTGGHKENFDISVTRFDGEYALVIQPVVPDDAAADVKNALAVRRLANLHGVCPACGAAVTMPNRAQRRAAARVGRTVPAVFRHEDDCIAFCDGDRRWS
ncbi:hypothetical protein GCM10010313_20380 [Streptomyces violarus]|uniref:Ribosomal protein S27AE n=1 Tax=Streptomyces violarus TaxID=67380 RepID=A0A7W4ZN43_9ACTN|nr:MULTISPECIES: hypothetical protein [Streptomyces]MBB3075562.1 ribosomal protein S27AE [Streptomyces violarus]WRT98157.1 hypothetical protein VJ737_10880 [Streptomyces sp. CGMCC 4.1772]GHD04281.1 hypothetical protein GCM10010313_20380 [Streptomyces violarus]